MVKFGYGEWKTKKEYGYLAFNFILNVAFIAVIYKIMAVIGEVDAPLISILLTSLIFGFTTSCASNIALGLWLKRECVVFITKDTIVKGEAK